ncbi:hypothetical protein GCM10009809_06890 [Isoptericola hypogeus]|uniref:Bacterial bifunctional deaminase-reductase C-terminal domain-containing protein n=1 Tax=Isoptericola hypogeus TaxID=300179 RepID=A0ABP4V0X1_9MICO
MTLVFTMLSASVDGYVSGRGARAGHGLGDGFRIFDWLNDPGSPNRAVIEYDSVRTGAVVSGRNTYEHADRWGGGSMQPGAPLFVISRDPIPDAAQGQTVVTDGLASAIRKATAVASEAGRDVKVAAGATTTEALRLGLLDEIVIDLVPVLLGGGIPFFRGLPDAIELECTSVAANPGGHAPDLPRRQVTSPSDGGLGRTERIMTMRLTTTTNVSVDGVMQGLGGPDEDRSEGFDRGGWAIPLVDAAAEEYLNRVYGSATAFLFGRRTYEIFAGSWGAVADPRANPVADALNNRPKYVASASLTDPGWAGTTVLRDDVAAAVRDLKERRDGDLLVPGSGRLVRWLLACGLVDQIDLLTYPVVIGQGTRLFPASGPDIALELISSRTTSRGITIQTYMPAGRPQYATGSVEDWE